MTTERDAASSYQLASVATREPVSALTISKQGEIILGTHHGLIMGRSLGDKVSGPTLDIAAHRSTVRVLHAHDDGSPEGTLISASADGTAKCWALPGGAWRMGFQCGDEIPVEAVAAAGDRLVTSSSDGTVRFWSISTGALQTQLRCHCSRVTTVSLPRVPADDTSGRSIADTVFMTGSEDGSAKLIDSRTKTVVMQLDAEAAILCGLYAHPHVIVGCADGVIRGFDAFTGQPQFTLRGHRGAVNAMVFSGGWLYSAGDDGRVIMWQAAKNGEARHVFAGHSMGIPCLAVDTEGRVHSGGFDHAVRVWDNLTVAARIREAQQAALEAALLAKQAAKKKLEEPDKKKKQQRR